LKLEVVCVCVHVCVCVCAFPFQLLHSIFLCIYIRSDHIHWSLYIHGHNLKQTTRKWVSWQSRKRRETSGTRT